MKVPLDVMRFAERDCLTSDTLGYNGVARCDDAGDVDKFHVAPAHKADSPEFEIMIQDTHASRVLADCGYDADWCREALAEKGMSPCIPSRKSRKAPIPHHAERYKKRQKIETSFACREDWRRVAIRYDRCLEGLFVSLRFGRDRHVLVMKPDPRMSFYTEPEKKPVVFYK